MMKNSSRLRFFTTLISTSCFSWLMGADYTVTAPSVAQWDAAINAVNSGGGNITFAFSPPVVNPTITMDSVLSITTTSPVTINATGGSPYVTISGNSLVPCFYIAPGASVSMENLTFTQGYSIGGQGGSALQGGGGGGGGLGAGGGIFVDSLANVTLTNVSFIGNLAVGGTGGVGSVIGVSGGGGGGGGGGAFYGSQLQGGAGGISNGSGGGGGGGGGGGSTPLPPSGNVGATGGALPMTLCGGLGGTPGVAGGSGSCSFGGGGGGGGISGAVPGRGGTGANFGGGGGGGGNIAPLGASSRGGAGGFGGGGGGEGAPLAGSTPLLPGGLGGFGGGGGSGAGSIYGGGIGGITGGGGAALGGALFVRDNAHVTIAITDSNLTDFLFTLNSVIPGNGQGAQSGTALSPDIFLNAGGFLNFVVNVPLIISTPICSDPDIFGSDQPIFVQGGSDLILSGNNTFGGGISVTGASSLLGINADANLGQPFIPGGGTVTLGGGASLSFLESTFSTSKPLQIGSGGGILVNSATDGISFPVLSGPISSIAGGEGVTILNGSGEGVIAFGGTNTYGGTTTIGPNATLQIQSNAGLSNNTNLSLQSGSVLDITALGAAFSGNIAGTGTLQIENNAALTLSGISTYKGTTEVGSGGVLTIGVTGALSPYTTLVDNGTIAMAFNTGVLSPTAISGNGSVKMNGSGTLILSLQDSYQGGTFFNAGIVQISGTSAVGIGGFTFNGGLLELTTAFGTGTLTNAMILSSGGGSVQVDSGAIVTLGEVISGPGRLTARGNGGTLILSQSNSYLGGTTFGSNSHVKIASQTNLGSSSSLLLFESGGELEITESITLANPITSSGGILTIDSGNAVTVSGLVTLSSTPGFTVQNSGVVTMSNKVTGPGSLLFLNSGTATLSSSVNDYLGGTTLAGGGILNIVNNASLGASSSPLSLNGTLSISSNAGVFTHPITTHASTIQTASSSNWNITGGINITASSLTLQNGGNLTISKKITGPGSLIVSGPGTVIVTAVNSDYSGGTYLNGGALEIFGPLGSAGSTITIQGGVLQIGSSMTVSQSMDLISGGIQVNSGVTAEFTNPFTIAGPFTVTSQSSALSTISSPVTMLAGSTLTLAGTGANTISSSISGVGSLICSGSNVNLSGNNSSFTGGMTINSGGVVNISSTPLALPLSCIDNGTLNLNLSSGTVGSSISGSGLVQIPASASLFLTGNNTYAGGTNILPGAIVTIVNANSIPSGGPISLRGSLIFNNASGTAEPGLITGAGNLGSVTMQGTGSLLLSQANAYRGGTTITAGTVILGQGSSLGTGGVSLGSNPSDLTPITLDFSSNSSLQTLTTSGIVLAGGSLTFSVEGAWQVPCPITSPSNLVPLTISGPGTFYYSGKNSSFGPTTIPGNVVLQDGSFAGPVTVSAGGSLQGSGAVGALTNSGVVHPSLGDVIAVAGNYTQDAGGELQIDIQGNGVCGAIQATGVANLDGTLSVMVPPIGAYALNQTYTIVTADSKIEGSGVFGEFQTVNLPAIPKMSVTYYSDPRVVLTVTEQSILNGAYVHYHNPKEVLENLQIIPLVGDTDLLNVLNVLAGLAENTDQLTQALNELHPAPFGAFELINLNTSTLITSILGRRQDEVCCSHEGSSCFLPHSSLWMHPFAYLYEQGRVGEQMGFVDKTIGFVSGIDYCGDGGFLIGAGGGYSTSQVHWHKDLGVGHMQSSFLGLYTDYSDRYAYMEFSLVGSMDSFSAYRNIDFSSITGSVDRRAKHTNGGYNGTAHFGIGGTISLGRVFLGPYFSTDYVYLQQNKFTETGADSLDLTVKARHTQMLRSEVGVEIGASLPMQDGGCFAPTLFLSGIDERYLVTKHYVANFVGEEPAFAVRTFNKPIFLFSPAIDLNFSFNSRFEFAVRYSAEWNRTITTQKADMRLELLF